VRRINAEGPQPTGKSREDAESDLTDLDAPKKAAAKKKAPATKTKKEIKIAPKDAKAKAKATTKAAAAKGKAKEAAKKDTKKDAKKGTKEPKKEVKKKEPEEPPVDPPVFNLVNSKLSYDEIEHRLYVSCHPWTLLTLSFASLSTASGRCSASPTVPSRTSTTLTTR